VEEQNQCAGKLFGDRSNVKSIGNIERFFVLKIRNSISLVHDDLSLVDDKGHAVEDALLLTLGQEAVDR